MRKLISAFAAGSFLLPLIIHARPCFGYKADWESSDDRATSDVVLGDFNGDGWKTKKGEVKIGNGKRHLFYLKHFPALTINEVRVSGSRVRRADYCFDAHNGWLSLKNAPPKDARVEVEYTWSTRLDLFAGNQVRTAVDAFDVINFNKGTALDRKPGWSSESQFDTYSCAAADFDCDGDVDVAIGGPDFLHLFKNTGAGLKRTPSWSCLRPAVHWAADLAWGDVDNDGYLELAVADCWVDDGRAYVFKNNGGVLESAPSWSVISGYACSVAWGDVDADGDLDLAAAGKRYEGSWGGYAYLYKNNGGKLATTYSWRSGPDKEKCNGLGWGDVNGDGHVDLVKSADPGMTKIFFTENGVLPSEPNWESNYYNYADQAHLAYCDGDARLDLIQPGGSGIVGYFHPAGGLRKYPSWEYSPGPPYHVFSVDLGDINNDGYVDVAAGCMTSSGYPRGGPNKVFYNKANIGVNVKNFAASACPRGVALRWDVNEAVAGFNVYREPKSAKVATEPARINDDLITGCSPYRYLDAAAEAGDTYYYWLEVVPLNGPAERHGPVECTAGVKTSFALAQNRPNPARATTTFAFSVPAACDATLAVYDIAGRRVATPYAGVAAAGENEVAVDVSALAPGVYTYRLEAGGEKAAKRMVVVR